LHDKKGEILRVRALRQGREPSEGKKKTAPKTNFEIKHSRETFRSLTSKKGEKLLSTKKKKKDCDRAQGSPKPASWKKRGPYTILQAVESVEGVIKKRGKQITKEGWNRKKESEKELYPPLTKVFQVVHSNLI